MAIAVARRGARARGRGGFGCLGLLFDSDDLDAVPGLIERVEAALGPIDVYIANTGGPPAGEDPLGFTREQWEAAHRTLVLSPMAFLERLLPGHARARLGARRRPSPPWPCASRSPTLQLSNAHRPG